VWDDEVESSKALKVGLRRAIKQPTEADEFLLRFSWKVLAKRNLLDRRLTLGCLAPRGEAGIADVRTWLNNVNKIEEW